MNTQKRFHITLTDNMTGEVYRDQDVDAIIGAIHVDEDKTGGLFLSYCPGIALAQTLDALKTTLKSAYSENPELEVLEAIVRARMGSSVEEYREGEADE